MSLNLFNKQKSLKRRFLLILGIAAFIAVASFGLMIMFWDKLELNMSHTQRLMVGGLVIGYAILRFTRVFKKQPDDE
jgi:hypothetical protein